MVIEYDNSGLIEGEVHNKSVQLFWLKIILVVLTHTIFFIRFSLCVIGLLRLLSLLCVIRRLQDLLCVIRTIRITEFIMCNLDTRITWFYYV